jgi:CTP:molybdopterin cytidylyltransferase MocA
MLLVSDDTPSGRDSAPHGRVFAVLLAAGCSLRFGGENKLLAPFRGKPLARHTLDLVYSLGKNYFSEILFIYSEERAAVLARNMTANASLAQHIPITLIRNAAPEKGQGESVRLGVQAAKAGGNDYFFFFPCDQPLLDADTLRLILADRKKGRIVEPRCRGEGGSPSLFSAVFLDELLSLRKGEAPRVIKARHPQAVFPVTVSNTLILADIDDMETLRRLDETAD